MVQCEQFDFHTEAAEIQPGTVKELNVEVLEPSLHARVTLVTLEDKRYELDWTVQNGLEVSALDGEAAPPGQHYEDLNQFLQANSPGYQKKFNDSLMEKLMALQGLSADRFARDDDEDDEEGDQH